MLSDSNFKLQHKYKGRREVDSGSQALDQRLADQ
jgi:hypothetical protein